MTSTIKQVGTVVKDIANGQVKGDKFEGGKTKTYGIKDGGVDNEKYRCYTSPHQAKALWVEPEAPFFVADSHRLLHAEKETEAIMEDVYKRQNTIRRLLSSLAARTSCQCSRKYHYYHTPET